MGPTKWSLSNASYLFTFFVADSQYLPQLGRQFRQGPGGIYDGIFTQRTRQRSGHEYGPSGRPPTVLAAAAAAVESLLRIKFPHYYRTYAHQTRYNSYYLLCIISQLNGCTVAYVTRFLTIQRLLPHLLVFEMKLL